MHSCSDGGAVLMMDYTPTEKETLRRARDWLRFWLMSGCPVCSGDCDAANPPVTACPVRGTMDTLREIHYLLAQDE